MGATFYKEKGFFLLKEEDISLEKKRGCDSEAWKGLQIFFNGENPHGTFCSLHAPGSTERGCHLAREWKSTRSLHQWKEGTHSEGKGGTISWKSTAHTVVILQEDTHRKQATLGDLCKQSTTTFTLYTGCNSGSLSRDKRFSKTQIVCARWVEHAQFASKTTITLIFT